MKIRHECCFYLYLHCHFRIERWHRISFPFLTYSSMEFWQVFTLFWSIDHGITVLNCQRMYSYSSKSGNMPRRANYFSYQSVIDHMINDISKFFYFWCNNLWNFVSRLYNYSLILLQAFQRIISLQLMDLKSISVFVFRWYCWEYRRNSTSTIYLNISI